MRTWLGRLADFTGHPYRLFNYGALTALAAYALYVKRDLSAATDATLSGTGLIVFGSQTWGWLLVAVGAYAIVVSGLSYGLMLSGYIPLISVTLGWALILLVGGWYAYHVGAATSDDAWGATGAGLLWGGASSGLWCEVLRLRKEAKECGHL